MPLLNIASAFGLARDDGTVQSFAPGWQEVSEADAAHWYVLAHATEPPKTALEVARDRVASTRATADAAIADHDAAVAALALLEPPPAPEPPPARKAKAEPAPTAEPTA